MDKYNETFQTWNNVAKQYEEQFMHLRLYNDSYDFFCNSIPVQNAKILDIGCGPGNISKYLISQRPNFKIYGIDIAPNMVSLARLNNPKAKFQVMDVRAIDQLESTYDGIICGFCIPYLSESDVDKLFKDCNNLLNEDGILYISFVEGQASKSGCTTGSSEDRSYFYYHSLASVTSKAIEYGLKEIKNFKVVFKETDMHSVLILQKEDRIDR